MRTDNKSSGDQGKAVLIFIGMRDGEQLSLEMSSDGEVREIFLEILIHSFK